jgi:hypothetical protein
MLFVALITQYTVPNATWVHPYSLSNGGSDPRVCDFDDMVQRVVKWHPSNHGFTATYSELISSRLGQLIEAPIVRGTVVYVDRRLLPPEVAGRVGQPYHLGFTYSAGRNFSEADYANIQNPPALPAAAVLLAWLQVADQESHNQYLYQLERVLPDRTTRKMNHFILVDQAAICGTWDWRDADLQPDAAYDLPPHLKSRVSMDDLEPVVETLSSIEEQDVRTCLDAYPDGWGITPEHVDKITGYLLDRRNHLGDVLRSNLV